MKVDLLIGMYNDRSIPNWHSYQVSIGNSKTHFWICPNLNGVVRQWFVNIFSMCKCIGPNYMLLNVGVHFFCYVSCCCLKSSPNFYESWNDVQSKLQRKPKLYIPSTLNTDYLLWHNWLLNHGLNHGLLFSLFKFFGWKNILT